jgi:hypothetical protein
MNSSSNLGSNVKVACLIDWDTHECVDGYSIKELKDLREKLDEAILRMAYENPNQHYLFGE